MKSKSSYKKTVVLLLITTASLSSGGCSKGKYPKSLIPNTNSEVQNQTSQDVTYQIKESNPDNADNKFDILFSHLTSRENYRVRNLNDNTLLVEGNETDLLVARQLTGGQSYRFKVEYNAGSSMLDKIVEVKLPRDIILHHDRVIPLDRLITENELESNFFDQSTPLVNEAPSVNRFIIEENATLVLKDQPFFLRAKKLISSGSITSFNVQLESNRARPGKVALAGSQVGIHTDELTGTRLNINVNGQDARAGSTEAPLTNRELLESSGISAICSDEIRVLSILPYTTESAYLPLRVGAAGGNGGSVHLKTEKAVSPLFNLTVTAEGGRQGLLHAAYFNYISTQVYSNERPSLCAIPNEAEVQEFQLSCIPGFGCDPLNPPPPPAPIVLARFPAPSQFNFNSIEPTPSEINALQQSRNGRAGQYCIDQAGSRFGSCEGN